MGSRIRLAALLSLVVISVYVVGVYGLSDRAYHAAGAYAPSPQAAFMSIPESLGSNMSAVFASSANLGFEGTADFIDATASGYMIGHRSGTKISFTSTDADRVVQSGSNAGQLTFSDYGNAVVIGHNNTNPTIKFYQDQGLAQLKGTMNPNGTISIIYGPELVANLPSASITNSNDYFTMQSLQDGSHTVILFWGVGALGVLASGTYFDMQYAGINTLTDAAYVIHWEDTNQNSIPDPSDNFTVIFQSSTPIPEIPIQSYGPLLGTIILLATFLSRRKKDHQGSPRKPTSVMGGRNCGCSCPLNRC